MTFKGGSRTAATSKMERFVIIVNGFQLLIIITKHFILDLAVVLDSPVMCPKLLRRRLILFSAFLNPI